MLSDFPRTDRFVVVVAAQVDAAKSMLEEITERERQHRRSLEAEVERMRELKRHKAEEIERFRKIKDEVSTVSSSAVLTYKRNATSLTQSDYGAGGAQGA